MPRSPVWKSIATEIGAEITAGHYGPGDRLPTEAALARRFDVNRHTVRRALSDLAVRGLVFSRRGAGTFVTSVSTDYPLGRRPRFHQSITATGRLPSRRVLSLETRASNAREAEALGIDRGARVHVYEALSVIDGTPVAIGRSVFPAERLPDLLKRLETQNSITAALIAEGIEDYTRHSTRITARIATASQANLLAIREGDPILRSVAINVAPDGRPIEFGHAWFAGDRLSLTLQGDDSQPPAQVPS